MVCLIIPAAGRSTRFPDMRPKWLLTHPNGNPMVVEAIRGLDFRKIKSVKLVLLKEHVQQQKLKLDLFVNTFSSVLSPWNPDLEIIQLEESTQSQPETVVKAINLGRVEGPIFVKDSDNFFDCGISGVNSVCTADLNQIDLVNVRNKSFVQLNEFNSVSNIVEKKVISSLICVGGYSFAEASEFVQCFESLKNDNKLYISHIIFKMILEGRVFSNTPVSGYVDWGTEKDWDLYKKQFATLFVDIDGCLVYNSGELTEPLWGSSTGIKENIGFLNKLRDTKKVQVILTTSRKSANKEQTFEQLKNLGIKYDQIIFDLFHTKRIIINDYAKTNKYPSCESINLKRDSSELQNLLEFFKV